MAEHEEKEVLTEVASKQLLKAAGIPVIETVLARTKREAMAVAGEMGFPVAMKIVSPDVPHKTDAGGVRLGLESAAQVGAAYSGILASVRSHVSGAVIEGVSLQKMAPPGVEIIIGMSRDAQFGPVIMFGLGGVLVEVLKDVSFRLVPVEPRDAAEMVREIKGYAILEGYRGQEPVDIPALERLIIAVSGFVEANPRVSELDLNPLIATGDGIVAVDARIIMDAEPPVNSRR